MAAEEILGISGQMDISDIQASLDKLCDGLNRVGVDTEALSQRMTKALNDIAQSDGDLASKTQQAMNVLKSAMDEATKGIKVVPEMIDTANKKVETIEGTIGKLNDELAKTDKTSNAFSSITKQIEAQKQSLQLAKEDVTDLTNSYANVKNVLSEVGGAYEALNAFSTASSTANGAQTVSNVAVGASATAAATATTAEAAAHTANAAAALGNADAESQNAQATQQLTAALQEYMSVASGRAEVERLQSESAKELKSDMKMYEETIKDIQTVLATSDFGGKIEDATKRIEYQKHIIEQYKEALANLSEGEKSGGTATYYNENIEVAKKKIEELQAKIGEWQHEQERLNNDLQEYNTLLDAAKKIQAGENLTGGFKKATEEAKNTAKETENIGKEAEKASEKAGGIFSKLKGALGGALKGDFSGVFSLFGKFGVWGAMIATAGKGLYDLTVRAEEFRNALLPLSHYLDESNLQTVRQNIINLSDETAKSVSDMAAAATQFVKVWEGLRDSPEALTTMIKSSNEFGALIGKTSEEGAKYLSILASEYHMTAQEATEASAMIATAAHNSTSNFGEMADAIASAGSTAALYGVSFKEMTTLIGYSSNQFGGAQKAASKFSMLLMSMSKMQDEYNPSVVGMVTALQNLKTAYDNGEHVENNFMARQRSAALYFIKNANAIARYSKGIGSNAAKQELLNDINARASVNVAKLQNAWNGFLTGINANLTPTLTKILKFFTRIISGAQRTTDELNYLNNFDKNHKGAKRGMQTTASATGGWLAGFRESNVANTGAIEQHQLSKGDGLELYRKQRDHLKRLYQKGLENARRKWKHASANAYANSAGNFMLQYYNKNRSAYSEITPQMFNELLSNQRTSTISLSQKPINTNTDLGGDSYVPKPKKDMTADQQRNYREQLAEQQAKQLADDKKIEWELYVAEQEEGIAKEHDANEKELKQRKLDFEKKKHQIEEEAETLRQKNIQLAKAAYDKNPSNKKKEGFYVSGLAKSVKLTNEQQQLIDAKMSTLNAQQEEEERKRLSLNLQSYREYLKEYGSLQDKRLAIVEEYNKKIDEAKAQGNVAESARLKEELDKQIKELNFSDFKDSINWDDIFSDMSRLSVSYLEGLRKKLKELLGSGMLSVNDMKAVSEQITNIDEAVSKQKDQWGLANDKVREHKRLLEEVADAQNELQNAQTDLAAAQVGATDKKMQIQSILATAGISVGVGDITYQSKDKLLDNDSIKKSSSRTEALRKLFDELAISETKVGKATENVAKAQDKEARAKEKSKWKVEDIAATVSHSLGKVLEKVQDLPELVSVLGLGNTGFGRAVNNGMSALGSAKSATESFASGNYIGAAINGIKAISSLGKVFGIGTGNGAEVAKTTQKLTESNERLQYSIEQLKSSIDKSSGMNAVNNYDKAYEAQKQINKQSMEILQTQMGYHGAHHSNAYYWNLSTQDYAAINKTLAQQEGVRGGYVNSTINKVSSLEDIYKLTPEQMADIRTYNQDVWKTMTDQGKYDKTSYWENYTELAGKLEELTEQINQNLTQTSFDSMKQDFISNLMDMSKTAQDFANDFTSMLNKSMLNFAVSDLMDKKLKPLYEKWATKMKQGQLSDDDLAELKKEYDDIADEGIKIRDNIANITGYKDAQSQQTATGKAIEAITTDQASTLIGIGYAVQIAVEQGNETRKAISIDVSSLRTFAEQTANNVSEMRDIQYQGLEQLEAINKNTAPIVFIREDISNMYKLMKERY